MMGTPNQHLKPSTVSVMVAALSRITTAKGSGTPNPPTQNQDEWASGIVLIRRQGFSCV